MTNEPEKELESISEDLKAVRRNTEEILRLLRLQSTQETVHVDTDAEIDLHPTAVITGTGRASGHRH